MTSSYCPFIHPTKESEATCNSNINKTSVAIASLKDRYPIIHQNQFPKRFEILTQKRFARHHHSVNRPDVFSIHVIKNSVILSHGDVILGNNILISFGCKLYSRLRLISEQGGRDYDSVPMYDEVFVMSTFYCLKEAAYYHKMLEALPRIAPYLDFVKSNPSVRIHVGDVSGRVPDFLNILGIPSDRLIGGGKRDIIRARVVYLPQDQCGDPQPAATALLALYYRSYMQSHYQPLPSEQDTVILIHRSLKRPLLNHETVASSLEKLAQEFGVKFVIFSDAAGYWSMEETMRLFDRALMVVGPHGAGLSNLIYSRPGTYVIEAMCPGPLITPCYIWNTEILGHHYYGVGAKSGNNTGKSCATPGIITNEKELMYAAKRFLEIHNETSA